MPQTQRDLTTATPADSTMSMEDVIGLIRNCKDAETGVGSNAAIAVTTLSQHKATILDAFQNQRIENITDEFRDALTALSPEFTAIIDALGIVQAACEAFTERAKGIYPAE